MEDVPVGLGSRVRKVDKEPPMGDEKNVCATICPPHTATVSKLRRFLSGYSAKTLPSVQVAGAWRGTKDKTAQTDQEMVTRVDH